MKSVLRRGLFVLLCVPPALAHDVETKVEFAIPSVIVRSTYAGAEPVAFGQVLVYSPANRKTEFQNGRTDANGGFSFLPDRDGEWLFVLDDELGHRKEIKIPVAQSRLATGSNEAAGPQSTWQKMIVGLAIILGTTGMLLWWKARKMLRGSGR